jgi:hypothetical protein
MLTIKIDTSQIQRLQQLLHKLGDQAPTAIRRAVNWTGERAHTRVLRALQEQTGAKQKSIRKYLFKRPALPGRTIVYRIIARAPAISLKEFDPRQQRSGVKASPWRRRHLFPHTFISSAMGDHVFVRHGAKRIMSKGRYAGKMRQPLHKLWGPSLANELVRNQSKQVFIDSTQRVLPRRLEHELGAILKGYAPKG